jgi:hypothetical protein
MHSERFGLWVASTPLGLMSLAQMLRTLEVNHLAGEKSGVHGIPTSPQWIERPRPGQSHQHISGYW